MSSLVEKLGKDPVRPLMIADCVDLIDGQVKQKGFIIKSAYATIKAIKKRFIPEVVDQMLDEWLAKIQPHYDGWQASQATKPSKLTDYMTAHGNAVAEDLLSVTDVRAEKTTHTTAKKMYGRMRDGAKQNVIEALPALASMLEKRMSVLPQ
jgi:hypothetical protein